MAYSLTSLVDKVRQTLGGAVAQAPKTLSGLGNRVSSNFNWAGQQAQQGATSFGKTVSQGLNTFDKGVTSLSNNPNPLINFMPKAITSAANANIKYQQAVQSKPVTFSKQGLQNYIDQQRLKLDAGIKTASPVLDVALAPTVGAATYLGSAGIGALFGGGSQMLDNISNKRNILTNVAQSAGYGAQQGLVQAPKISTIAGITNPAINQAAGKVLAKFPNLSEVGKAIVNRVIQGSLSIPEGMAMAKATGQDYSITNAAIDFAVGSGLARKAGTMAIDGPYGNGKSGMVGNPRYIHPDDYKLYDQANTIIHEKGKFSPAEIAKAADDLRLIGEKYLPVADQPASGNPVLIANRLTKRMADGALPTSGDVGAVKLDEPIGLQGKGKIKKISDKQVFGDSVIEMKDSYGNGFLQIKGKNSTGLSRKGEMVQKSLAELEPNATQQVSPTRYGDWKNHDGVEVVEIGENRFIQKQIFDKLIQVYPDAKFYINPKYTRSIIMAKMGDEVVGAMAPIQKYTDNILLENAKDFQIPNSVVKSQSTKIITNEPIIDRTKLTGRQLDMTNEQIKQRPAMAKSLAQDGQVSQPVSTKPEVSPWETPEYLAKNPSTENIQTQSVDPKILKQELNQTVKATTQAQTYHRIPQNLSQDIATTSRAIDSKVNILDYMRTPDRVLEKIGLKKAATEIKSAYNSYLDELPVEIGKVTKWYDRVKADPTASQRLFRFLDGDKTAQLNPTEKVVAGEIRAYLDKWAERLNLPVENRLANYITHIFERDFIQKEFDPELAKIIQEKVPGSVYDPFLQQRLGKLGYVEDVFRALDAYTKRAVRKANMDPALEKLKLSAENLDIDSWNYVKSYADRINLRPTQIDNLLDNLIKQSPVGYKLGQRPVTSVSRRVRQAVYRGTLGLNVGSALRNLTQGVNTYAKLGEKYTSLGYVKVLKEIAMNGDELTKSGVLRDNVIQDRQLSAVKGFTERLDTGLFALFNTVEKINRGSAYFGAKAKYLSEGLSEAEAIKKAVNLARDTQFTFGSVDTPVALQSDLVKTFTQFQSFNIKQTEFLAEMVKNKEFTGLLRWVGANLVIMATVGNLINMDLKDIIPFGGILSGQSRLGETPPVKLLTDFVGAVSNAPDKYGAVSKDAMPMRVGKALLKTAPAFLPGGVQIKKTIEGLKAVNDAGSYSKTGKLQYPIPQDVGTGIRAGLFGKSNLDQAQWYFDNNINVLGDKQTQGYKEAQDKMKFYREIMEKREQNRRGGTEVKPTLDLPVSKKVKQPTLKIKKTKAAGSKAQKQGRRIAVKMRKVPKAKTIKIKRFTPKAIKIKPLKLKKYTIKLN